MTCPDSTDGGGIGEYDYTGRAPGQPAPKTARHYELDERTHSGALTTKELIEIAQEHVANELKRTDPRDDLSPRVCFLLPDKFAVLLAPGAMMNSGPLKDLLAQAVAEIIRQKKARAVCVISTMWWREIIVTAENRAEIERQANLPLRQQPSLEHDPKKTEAIGLWVYDRNGEQFFRAKLKRHAHRHPTLGEWLPVPHMIDSRFAEGIMPAFTANN